MNKTLYKKDTKGKIRILELSTEGSLFIQTSGIIDGKLVRHEKECKPKNVGKSNSTSAVEQAIAECNAKYEIKLSEGYFSSREEAEKEEVLMPMLAKVYEDHSSKINWDGDVFIQPKLDGMRCLAVVKDGNVKLISRKNKAIETMGHIEAELAFYPDGTYDGELYAHGKTFQENMKLIKKLRPESNQVKFHMYDMVEEDTFIKRYTKLVTVFSAEKDRTQHLKRVPTYRLNTESGIGIIHGDYLSQGYEGSMIRHGDAPYKINGRSDQLLKYKQFQDLKLKIIDIIPAEARPEWGTPVFELNGKQFKAGTKMSHDDRIDFLKNRDIYIGSFAEVRFFEYTDDGLPRFPIMEGEKLD